MHICIWLYQSINQMTCSSEHVIFLSLVAFSAYVTHPTFSHLGSPSNIFSPRFRLLHFPSIILAVTRCSFSLFLSHGRKRLSGIYVFYLIINDHIMLPSCNTVSFDFFAVHAICSIFHMNHISIVSSFCCTCFEIVRAWHLCILYTTVLKRTCIVSKIFYKDSITQ